MTTGFQSFSADAIYASDGISQKNVKQIAAHLRVTLPCNQIQKAQIVNFARTAKQKGLSIPDYIATLSNPVQPCPQDMMGQEGTGSELSLRDQVKSQAIQVCFDQMDQIVTEAVQEVSPHIPALMGQMFRRKLSAEVTQNFTLLQGQAPADVLSLLLQQNGIEQPRQLKSAEPI